jgi:membrane-bound metal-dependent hydrolase YbcI (DUF457 family)
MSRGGHTLLGLATGGFVALAFPGYALLGLTAAVAGTLPDAIEVVTGFGPNGERRSLIPHRTLTHSPYPYIALVIFGLRLPNVIVGHIIAGIGMAALVHLAVDLLSPSGVPLANPFGTRSSFGPFRSGGVHPYLYRTSTAEEWPVLMPFAFLAVIEAACLLSLLRFGLPSPAALLRAFGNG